MLQGNSLKTPLQLAVEYETNKFAACYSWLEKAMPAVFFEEVNPENIPLVAHSLIGFDLQDYFSTINIQGIALVMCLDSPDADLNILKDFSDYGIRDYQCFISSMPPPFPNCHTNLRIAIIQYTETYKAYEPLPMDYKEKLYNEIQILEPELSLKELENIIASINPSFLRSLIIDNLTSALAMFFRARTRDNCQYKISYIENWEAQPQASMQIVLAWKNTPKHQFLYQLAELINRHSLTIKKVSATYVNTENQENILVMVLSLHGSDGKAAWNATNLPDFLRELATTKYFYESDLISSKLVNKGVITGCNGFLLRAMANFIQQALVHIDPNIYTLDKIKEDLCRHPEFSIKLIEAFTAKFHPELFDLPRFNLLTQETENDIERLDTGIEENDIRRKNIFKMGLSFIKNTLKTNFFRLNYSAMSFRIDPKYLEDIPFERTKKFPELPFAIFFIKGMHFFGFHIRFKDLARGGLRTVYLEHSEHSQQESNNVFIECYNLAHTQHLKNKDIPEGGAKGIIFLKPWERIAAEAAILENELTVGGFSEQEIKNKIKNFYQQQKEEYLHQSQRAFVEGLITLVNCDASGKIKAKNIVDYWQKPEYIYLGPDENMHDEIIDWIAKFSERVHYKPGSTFISGKPLSGINHKEYGVTSLGVNVYMQIILHYLGKDPTKDIFTVKMTGGPDGDVAGNQILNLARCYPETAKLLALTDISGSIYDPLGLKLPLLVELFHQAKSIKHYPPEELSEGGFLLNKQAKRSQTSFAQQTLCWKKVGGKLLELWLSGSEMNQLWRNNVHQVEADIFIPAGGRPKTLNESNYQEFLDPTGKPTAKAIIEGANLYLTPQARRALEKLGVLILKDSSANKTGVICSSFEVLCGLAIGDKLFLENKPALTKEIAHRLHRCAYNEGHLLLRTHIETGENLTEISSRISERINYFKYQLLNYLDSQSLDINSDGPLLQCFFDYCLPTLKEKFPDRLLSEIPEHHKKAIIACHLAAQIVYSKGLNWFPSIVDILPLLLSTYSKDALEAAK